MLRTFARFLFVKLFKSSAAPQWAVLLTDMVSCVIAILMVCGFNVSSHADVVDIPVYVTQMGLFCFIPYLIFSLLTGSYRFIVRLSIMEDIQRIAVVVVLSSLLTMAIATVFRFSSGYLPVRVWDIYLVGVITFTFMMIVRMSVKSLYRMFLDDISKCRPVVIYGYDFNSVTLANALKGESDCRYYPVGLLAVGKVEGDKAINGLSVISFDAGTISESFKRLKCDTLLLMSSQLPDIRGAVAETLLDNNIKLLVINRAQEYMSEADGPRPLSQGVRHIKIEDLLARLPIDQEKSYSRSMIRGKVVMITGAAGSIGSEIVRQTAQFGAAGIVLVDQAETPMHDLSLEIAASFPAVRCDYYVADVTDRKRMDQIFKDSNPQFVFHAAAYKHVPMMEDNPVTAVKNNVFGTKIIADLSVRYNVDKFVMISTDKAVNPSNIMGATKRIAEIYVQSLNNESGAKGRSRTRFVTTRFGNVLGSNGSVIPIFTRQIENGGPVTVTDRNIIRYFMTIPEACSLVLEAAARSNGGEIYIFDMGKAVKIYDLACRMITLAGYRPGVDIKIVETGLRPGEKLYEELLSDREKTMPTSHSKIMIAKVVTYGFGEVMAHMNALRTFVDDNNSFAVVAEMKRMVPEFVSKNSKWAEIDRFMREHDDKDSVLKEMSVSDRQTDLNN